MSKKRKRKPRDTEVHEPAGGDAELVHLLAAVEVDAGHPTYARLARRYWKTGNVVRALEVAQAGFSANPTCEPGALVYLELLASEGALESAADVFGQAAAEIPRSAQLRLVWAEILDGAGRTEEARRRAREAVELSPRNTDARSLLARLGGGAPPMAHQTRPMADPTGQAFVHGDSGPDDSADHRRPHIGAYSRSIMELLNEPKFSAVKNGGASHPMDYILADGAEAEPGPPADRPSRPPANARADAEQPPKAQYAEQPHEQRDARPHSPPVPATEAQVDRETRQPAPRRRMATGPHLPAHRGGYDQPDNEGQYQRETPRPQIDPNATLAHAVEIYAKQNQRRRRTIGALLLVCVGVVATAGWFFLQHQRLEVQGDVLQEMARLEKDRYADYVQTSDALSALLSQNPNDQKSHAAAALVNAHIWSRFSRDPNALRDAHAHLKRALDSLSKARIANALLALGAGDFDSAKRQLNLIPAPDKDWHYAIAQSWLLTELKNPSEASALLAKAAAETSAAAVYYGKARLNRLQGDIIGAKAALTKGLESSPQHPGLLLEKIALDTTVNEEEREAGLAALEAKVVNANIYRSSLALLRARDAIARREWPLARKLSDIALKADESNFEAQLLASEVLLLPGGDVNAALKALAKLSAVLDQYRPGYKLIPAKAMLLGGHPDQAKQLVSRLTTKGVNRKEQTTLFCLRVLIAETLDDHLTVTTLCEMKPLGRPQTLACVEALYAMGAADKAAELGKSLKLAAAQERYLNALNFTSRQELDKAADLLRHWQINGLPNRDAPLEALARLYGRRGSYLLAVESYGELKRQEANSARASLGLAWNLAAAGRTTQAKAELVSFLTDRPTDTKLLLNSGRLLLSLDEADLVQAIVDSHEAEKDRTPSLQLLRGELALHQRRWQSAEQAFQWVIDQSPQSVPALLGRATAAHTLGRAKEASDYLDRAEKASAGNGERSINVAVALAEAAMFKRALQLGKQATKGMHDAGSLHQAAAAEARLGAKLLVGDKATVAAAMRLLEHAVESSYAPPNAYLELGRAYRSQDKVEKATSMFREALIRDNDLSVAHYELGLTLSKVADRREEAVEALSLYLKLEPVGKLAKRAQGLVAALQTAQRPDGKASSNKKTSAK